MKKALSTILLSAVLSTSILACGTRALILGRVTNGSQGVPRARVSTGGFTVLTDSFGYYSIYVPDCGEYHLTATAKMYTFTSDDIFLPVADANVVEVDFAAIW